MRFETELVQFEPSPGDPHSPSSTPIYQTSTYRLQAGKAAIYDYSRSGNPTRTVLEDQLARLEKGKYGLAFASGMAALDAVTSLVPPGHEIIAGMDLYGGTFRLLTRILLQRGISARFCDTTSVRELAGALTNRTALVLVENPSNPLFRITDIAGVAAVVHESKALLAVDNSLLSPFLQQPLALGADLVVHSATKHLGGHSDVTAGVTVSNSPEIHRKLANYQNSVGSALAPFDCWLLLRGIETLALRLGKQQQNARRIVRFLRMETGIREIYYPALDDPGSGQTQKKQARGAGSVISLETGSREQSERLVQALELFGLSVSFGGVHSSVCLPTQMSHACIPKTVRAQRRFPEDLVRLSIGIEHWKDLLDDLNQALGSSGLRRQRISRSSLVEAP